MTRQVSIQANTNWFQYSFHNYFYVLYPSLLTSQMSHGFTSTSLPAPNSKIDLSKLAPVVINSPPSLGGINTKKTGKSNLGKDGEEDVKVLEFKIDLVGKGMSCIECIYNLVFLDERKAKLKPKPQLKTQRSTTGIYSTLKKWLKKNMGKSLILGRGMVWILLGICNE